MDKADLHVHTRASDGDLSPGEIVALAAKRELLAVAITDHDTMTGAPEGLQAGSRLNVNVIPGIEISAVYDPGTLHMLGYFGDFPSWLEDDLERIQKGRLDRLPRIIERLKGIGLDVSIEDVSHIAGDAQIGRPHIAKALIKNGYVKNFEEAFDKYLGKGKPAYVEKEKLTWKEAIALIKRHNGISVLAHPFTLELKGYELKTLVICMKDAGLNGIEVYYPEHTPEQTKLYKAIALDAGLMLTGGSDFHTPDRGAALGDCGIGEDHLKIILNHLQYKKPVRLER
jgi:3',5'-nucleoside bisphosphate phosphatase